MIYRKGVKRPEHVYPADPWRLVEKRFYPRLLPQTELDMDAVGRRLLAIVAERLQ